MGRIICKVFDVLSDQDLYFEWSTIADGPVTHGMTLIEFKKYYQSEYGNLGLKDLENKYIKDVQLYGTSDRSTSVADLLEERALNRERLTLADLIKILTANKKKTYKSQAHEIMQESGLNDCIIKAIPDRELASDIITVVINVIDSMQNSYDALRATKETYREKLEAITKIVKT